MIIIISNSHTIPIDEKFLYSEFYSKCVVDGKTYDFDCNTAKDDPIFLKAIDDQIEAYDRLADDCWWTKHSSVYDLASKSLHLVVREMYDKV